MTQTKEVTTTVGKFIIKKPKAGARNKAMAAAEGEHGLKMTVLLSELLPKCIQSRPDGFDKDVPIDHILNDLEIEDYDMLALALADLIQGTADLDAEKKTQSTSSLTQDTSQKENQNVLG